MQFQVANICYSKLNLLLLAMEARKYEGGDIYINPRDKIINPNAIGKFTSKDVTVPVWFSNNVCNHNTYEKWKIELPL